MTTATARTPLAVAIFAALALAWPLSATAADEINSRDIGKRPQLSTRFKINAANPEASVPTDQEKNASPLEFGYYLQDLLDRAEAARNFQQVDVEISYYRAVAKAVPEMAKGWSKLCEAYELARMRDKALRACQYAIERPGSELGDFQRYVRLAVTKDGPLSAEEKASVTKVFDHLSKNASVAVPLQRMICDVAVHDGDVKSLETCSLRLTELRPGDPSAVVYKWHLAMKKGQYREAKRLVGEAKALPIPPDGVKRMEQLTSRARFSAWPKWMIPGLILLLAAALAWKLRRNRMLAR